MNKTTISRRIERGAVVADTALVGVLVTLGATACSALDAATWGGRTQPQRARRNLRTVSPRSTPTLRRRLETQRSAAWAIEGDGNCNAPVGVLGGARPDLGTRINAPRLPLCALVRCARPRQWVKNLLVFAAPGAAGALTEARIIGRAGLTFILFCLASSGAYLLNDAVDHVADRLHPTKRCRPIAVGDLGPSTAKVAAAFLFLAAVCLCELTVGHRLALVIAAYVVLTSSYSIGLKNKPVVDLAVIASGFVLRVIAGAVSADVPVSAWFLIVILFSSLFVAAGKRQAEFVRLGESRGQHRVTLDAYSLPLLCLIRSFTGAVTLTAYCLWAFELGARAAQPVWQQLSIVPFAVSMLCYSLRVRAGEGEAPEDLALGDGSLQFLVLAWAVLFALGAYGG